MRKNIWIMNHYAGETLFDCGGRHYAFAKYLKRAGYEPVVFCANAKHGEAERFLDTEALWTEKTAEEIGVPFVFVKARPYTGNGKQRVLNMFDFYRNVQKAAREYAQAHGKPDVIYASSVHPLTIVAGIHLAKYFGVKCVGEVRDLWPESLIAYGMAGPHHPAVLALRRLEKWIYKKADATVFTMEGAYEYIIEQGWEKDIPRSKVHYINNGVDLEQFNYNKEHFKLTDADLDNLERFKVVYTGSIRKVNNLGLLLDAAKQVTKPHIVFLIWGDGDELPALRQRVEDEKINNVVFKGRVDKEYVPYIVSCASANIAHCGSTDVDRFGISFNKMFEYFAAGRIILSDFPTAYNPATQCGAGITVADVSAKSVAAAVESLAALSIEQRAEYEACSRNAAHKYDFERLTKDLVDVIDSIPSEKAQ